MLDTESSTLDAFFCGGTIRERHLPVDGHEERWAVIEVPTPGDWAFFKSRKKDDRLDARTLARLARIDPQLLSPVQHRSAEAQIHLTEIRARAELVRARTALVNSARGLAKSYGERLRKCGTQPVGRELAMGLSAELRAALDPLLREIESLNEHIKESDR